VPDHDAPVETMWAGKFIAAKKQGRWEYVSRTRGMRAVVILAIDAGHVLLVEQYRVPLGRPCLELPAGIVGDEGDPDEAAETAAARELEEETGYRAADMVCVGEFHSSPGLVSESFTLVRATDLTRVSVGGGVGDENIIVHRVALSELKAFVATKRSEGMAIAAQLLVALGSELLS